VLLGLASSQVPDSDLLVSVLSDAAARAVLGVFLVLPLGLGSALAAAPLHLDLVNRQPAVDWGDVVGEVGLDGAALLDALPDGAAANGLDSILSDEAVSAWSWVGARSALADLLQAAVGRANDRNGLESLWSDTDLVSNVLAFAGLDLTAHLSGGRDKLLVSVTVVIGRMAWALADLLLAAVDRTWDSHGLENLWQNTWGLVGDGLALAGLDLAAHLGGGRDKLLVSVTVVIGRMAWALADLLLAAVDRTWDSHGLENLWQNTWGLVGDGLALAGLDLAAHLGGGRDKLLVSVTVVIGRMAWAPADLLLAAVGGTSDSHGSENLWQITWGLVGDGLALASPGLATFIRGLSLDLLVISAIISGLSRWTSADPLGAAVGGAFDSDGLQSFGELAWLIRDSLALADVSRAASDSGGGNQLLVGVAVASGRRGWALADLGLTRRAVNWLLGDDLWRWAWGWVGDVLAHASPSIALIHGGLERVFVDIVTGWLVSRWALALLVIAVRALDRHLNGDLWMCTVGPWWDNLANAFVGWATVDGRGLGLLVRVGTDGWSGLWTLALVLPADRAGDGHLDRNHWGDAVGPWGWGLTPTVGSWANTVSDVVSLVVLVVLRLAVSIGLRGMWWANALVVDAAGWLGDRLVELWSDTGGDLGLGDALASPFNATVGVSSGLGPLVIDASWLVNDVTLAFPAWTAVGKSDSLGVPVGATVGPLRNVLTLAPLAGAVVGVSVILNLLVVFADWVLEGLAPAGLGWATGLVLGIVLFHTGLAVGIGDWLADTVPREAAIVSDVLFGLLEVAAVGPHWPVRAWVAALDLWALGTLIGNGLLGLASWADLLPPRALDVWTTLIGLTVGDLLVAVWAGDFLVNALLSWAAFVINSGGDILAREAVLFGGLVSVVELALDFLDARTLVALLLGALVVDVDELLALLTFLVHVELRIPGRTGVGIASVTRAALVLVLVVAALLLVGLLQALELASRLVAAW